MSEFAPTNNQDYKDHYPNAVEDVDKAHAMAVESHKTRSEAARTRGIGKLILDEVQKGTDAFGRGTAERFALRTDDAEQTVFPQKYIGVSEDMERPALEKAGLHGPAARNLQLDRMYDARRAINNNGGNAEKAVEQIEKWSEHLDTQADSIEDTAAAEFDAQEKASK